MKKSKSRLLMLAICACSLLPACSKTMSVKFYPSKDIDWEKVDTVTWDITDIYSYNSLRFSASQIFSFYGETPYMYTSLKIFCIKTIDSATKEKNNILFFDYNTIYHFSLFGPYIYDWQSHNFSEDYYFKYSYNTSSRIAKVEVENITYCFEGLKYVSKYNFETEEEEVLYEYTK